MMRAARAARDTLLLGWWTAFPRTTSWRHITEEDIDLDGLRVRSYAAPSGRYPLVVLHGLTRKGYDDVRLATFCRTLAATGFVVYSPDLDGLRNLDLDVSDIERITHTIRVARERHGRPVGVIGFSVGATYGLIASAEPSARSLVGYAAACGGYYALDAVLDNVFARENPEWYLILAMDWQHIDALGLTPAEDEAYRSLMSDCCRKEATFFDAERELIRSITENPGQAEVQRWWKDRLPTMHALELAGNPYLDQIEASVLLLTSRDDPLIPPEETLRIHEAHPDATLCVQQSAGHTDYERGELPGLARLFHRIMLLRQEADDS